MRRRLRRIPALSLLTIFLGAAAAPHRHLNPIADLFSDRPSDSGTFVEIAGQGSLDRGVYPGGLVRDESCCACFHSDFVASPAIALVLTQALLPAAHRTHLVSPGEPAALLSDTSSRAPPAVS